MSTFTVGLGVLAAELLAVILSMALLSNHLKANHRAVWNQFRPNRWSGLEPLNPFLRRRVYADLADERLTKLSLTVLWLRRLWIATAVVWLVWLFLVSR